MRYYRIRHSLDSKVIGRKYPQIKQVLIPTTWDDPMFIQSYIGQKAPENVLLPTPILYKSSKITDLVSASTVGLSLSLLVSNRLKLLLQSSLSFGMQFFEIQLLANNGLEHSYSIVHSFNSGYCFLNFKDSEIGYYKQTGGSDLTQSINSSTSKDLEKEISDYERYLANASSLDKYLFIKRIEFDKQSGIDFFALSYVHGGTGFFVSENLKNEIEAAGCTGIVFTEPNERYP